ncbi:MAG: molybdopterin-dependent oxidoreductase [Proteobacteria bacterium]|nr:molybdopterin-dependent oxidoreductase [Pseudomonadota bacterium]MDA1117292.1 molybdopterin-dependent oxidoreductase [Pseudomonadota bacterium]
MAARAGSKIVRTMCPMSCHPTLCGMLAEVREGKLVGVKGDEANPDSQGFLCIRGQASPEIFDNPARLLHPLVRDRRSDRFRRATWDEALERIVASMAQSPPAATALWPGHGTFTTNYGTRISAQLMARFANFHGSQFWSPTMICWGLGAFGLGLTGMLETNTKEDMGENSQLILLWAANLASQPNTARHLLAAKRRGAHIVTIDVRHTEAAAKSDDVLILRPGSDTALALAMMHVICAERRHDAAFVARHTVGFEQLAAHVQVFSPDWAAGVTGIAAERIVALARRYAGTRPAMIVLGGSSMHKGSNGWQAGRAIACLPGLTGNVGIAGSGFGPRHGSAAHGRGLGSIIEPQRRVPGTAMPNQMSGVTAALREGRIHTLLLMGTNMLSSFPDAGTVASGLEQTRLVVSYDLFLNDTARRYADIVLPGTAWLEELGCKMTHTHLYLMEPALAPAGETRSVHWLIRTLAERMELEGFYPWASEEAMVDAILDHPCTGHATVASLRAQGGIAALNISHVANPKFDFETPSRKIEFYSAQAQSLGLPPLPSVDARGSTASDYPLTLTQGRTLTHFHAFYNNGSELPTLARRESEAQLWVASADAAERRVTDGAAIRIFNQRGELSARAHVTDRIPAGTVWMRDGWPGLNRLTAGTAVLPDAAVDLFAFSAGQASFDARVEVALA